MKKVLAGVLILGLLLSACGSKSSESPTEAANAPATEVETTAQKKPADSADSTSVQKPAGTDGQQAASQNLSDITYTPDSITKDLTISDYIYIYEGGTSDSASHILEITNNSPYMLDISINETAMDSSGAMVGAESAEGRFIPSGHTVFITNYFSDVSDISNFDTSIQTKETSSNYDPVAQNISVETTNLESKAIISVTNDGSVPVFFVQATVLFFNGDKVAGVQSTYLIDGDDELKPDATISKQVSCYEEYTSVQVHVTGYYYE